MPSITLSFRCCTLYIDPADRYCETWFRTTRRKVPVRPNNDPASVALAHELGYHGDTWRMSYEHDFLHSLLSEMIGNPRSYTLWLLAEGRANEDLEYQHREERLVLDCQRWLNTAECSDLLWSELGDVLGEVRERVEAVRVSMEG